jgi:hypothetical protein
MASNPDVLAWKESIYRPIEFYGKVVDENEQPIAGAAVSFTYTRLIPPEGASGTNTISDKNGLFSLSGVKGSTLEVQVAKVGYYSSRREDQHGFDYKTISGSQPFQPDSNQPIIFHLRRKRQGVDLITSQHGISPALVISGVHDGSPVRVDFFHQTVGPDGQLELSSLKPVAGQKPADWWFRISIPDGGLVETTDEFPAEAPESGYQTTLEYDFKEGDTNRTRNLHKEYYIVFGQPPKYGRVEVDTSIYTGIQLSYAINPDGSRNLEGKDPSFPAPPMEFPGGVRVVPSQGK